MPVAICCVNWAWTSSPRTFLANVDGAEVVELAGSEECCGFGGLFSVKNAGISTAMGQRKCLNRGAK